MNQKWIALLLALILALSVCGCAADKPQTETAETTASVETQTAAGQSTVTDEELTQTAQWLMEQIPQPTYGSVGGEWAVFGLARSGVAVPKEYFEVYGENVAASTEYSRVMLAWTALGKNATDVGGFNLLVPLADFDQTVFQGINGPIFALLALDSGAYDIPENTAGTTQATRDGYVDYILNAELPDGGWSFAGGDAETDITAMALQALAPYYRNSTFNVKDPVDKALGCLSELQLDTGDFRSWGTRNSESVSQIIVSLCSIGVDPQNDTRFIKNGINLLDALFYYQQEDGGFAHSYESDPGNPSAIPGESNSIATDQALLALVAVWRQAQGMSILYDFRPGSVSAKILTPEESEVSFAGSYEFTEADQQQADALPQKLTTENDAEVTALLNKLKMSRDFDGYDTYMTKLTQAKSDIDALYAEIESLNADIQEQIISMTEPGLGEKSTVDRLVKRYEALSDHDKELVQNWDTVLAVKAQTDAAQRNLFLIIGGAVVVMVAVTVVVRRRRESK